MSEIAVSVLAHVLFLIERYNISIEKAFKEACRLYKCPKDLNSREILFETTKEFIKNIIKLRCLFGAELSRKRLAKLFLSHKQEIERKELEPWCSYSVPKWFYEKLVSLIGDQETRSLLESIERRVFWIRINTLKAPEEKILRILEEDEIVLERDKDLWYLYRVISYKKPLRYSRALRDYYAVIQDKASCLVVEALKPSSDDKIFDVAAAPGIKTSLIAMLTNDEARIVAGDLSKKRVVIMKHLLKKLGVKRSVDIILHNGIFAPVRRDYFNKILIDAPCSSSGAISKDPSIRLSLLRKDKIYYYTEVQEKLLSRALDLGDEIVYATCSLLPEEGEEIVSRFLDKVSLEKILDGYSRGYNTYEYHDYFVRTFPHRDLSEGFFIAKIRNTK